MDTPTETLQEGAGSAPAGAAGRRVDALRVAAAGELADRSRFELGTGRLSAKKGCRTPSELVQRVTLVSAPTANRRVRLGSQVRTDYSLVGLAVPPKFSATAAGLTTGVRSSTMDLQFRRVKGPVRRHDQLRARLLPMSR